MSDESAPLTDGHSLDESRIALLKATVYGRESPIPAPSSQQQEQERAFESLGALEPPFNPRMLTMLMENSSALRQCVDAYATNIEAFGHRFVPVIDLDADDARDRVAATLTDEGEIAEPPDDETTEDRATREAAEKLVIDRRLRKIRREARTEKLRLESFFESCSVECSFPELRQRTRFDREVQGNAYWEVLRNALGEVVQFVYVPAHTVRLLPIDKEPTVFRHTFRGSPFKTETLEVTRRARRYVQMYEQTGQALSWQHTYFKEFGDPRVISCRRGDVVESADALKVRDSSDAPANELIHFKVHSPISPYGVPRWIGASLSVLGSRLAEEVNFYYFENKSVPPLAILVSGGKLNEEAAKRLEDYISTEIRGKTNFHKVLVLDAAAADDGTVNSGRMKITIQPLTGAQHNDALFQNYDERNMDKIGMTFRLPRLLRGDTREVNRATSEAALAFTEIQVFGPERESFDFLINRWLLSEMGVRFWRFKTNSPSLQDSNALALVVSQLTAAGVLIPEEAREISETIFNREFVKLGDPWTKQPITLTLAGIQGGSLSGVPGDDGMPLDAPVAPLSPTDATTPAAPAKPLAGASWLKRLREGDVRKAATELIALRDELRKREAVEVVEEFRRENTHSHAPVKMR